MSEKSCHNCLYYDFIMGCSAERCNDTFDGWRPKAGTVSFIDLVKDALPNKEETREMDHIINPPFIKEEEFSLDKLINDHWNYIEDLLKVHSQEPEVIEIAEFHYRTAALHFWKHCKEHHNIKESDDE